MVEKRTIHQLFQHLNIISCLQAPTCKELKASLLQAGFLYLERIVLHKKTRPLGKDGKGVKMKKCFVLLRLFVDMLISYKLNVKIL